MEYKLLLLPLFLTEEFTLLWITKIDNTKQILKSERS